MRNGGKDMSKVKVAPSILSADFAKMAEAVQNLDKWHADVIHCDVMDGVFVPNITFGMDMIKALRKYTNGILDVHLMIIKPEKYIPQFIAAGADVITFHPDASDDVAGAFYGCRRLKSVTIPDGVTSIESCAFYGCCSLTSVTIGNGVTSIGDEAFYNCTSLQQLTIPDGVTSYGADCFEGCL